MKNTALGTERERESAFKQLNETNHNASLLGEHIYWQHVDILHLTYFICLNGQLRNWPTLWT